MSNDRKKVLDDSVKVRRNTPLAESVKSDHASWRTSSPKLAVALNYKEGDMDAPEVSMMGRDCIAQEILKVSKRYGVPIKKSSALAEKLSNVAPETPIPEELYEEVAEVFLSLSKK